MMEALVNLVHPLPPDENIAALTRSPLLTKPTLDDRLRNGDFYNWVYRHRTVDGGHTHIHKKVCFIIRSMLPELTISIA